MLIEPLLSDASIDRKFADKQFADESRRLCDLSRVFGLPRVQFTNFFTLGLGNELGRIVDHCQLVVKNGDTPFRKYGYSKRPLFLMEVFIPAARGEAVARLSVPVRDMVVSDFRFALTAQRPVLDTHVVKISKSERPAGFFMTAQLLGRQDNDWISRTLGRDFQ